MADKPSKLLKILHEKDHFWNLAGTGALYGLTGDEPSEFINKISEEYELDAYIEAQEAEIKRLREALGDIKAMSQKTDCMDAISICSDIESEIEAALKKGE